MRITLKGSPSSGWYAPPKGTHSGDKHRAVGSGRSVAEANERQGYKFGPGSAGEWSHEHPSSTRACSMLNAGLVSDFASSSDAEVEKIKAAIISELAERTGIESKYIYGYISEWEYSCNDEDMRALALQKDAAAEFGVSLSEWQQGHYDNVRNEWKEVQLSHAPGDVPSNIAEAYAPRLASSEQRSFVRAMYEHTQEKLAAQGFSSTDTVRLYRGVVLDANSWKAGGVVQYNGNVLDSWSADKSIAGTFVNSLYRGDMGFILEMDVPIGNIISTGRTGIGQLSEGEFVIAGNVGGSQARIACHTTITDTKVSEEWWEG